MGSEPGHRDLDWIELHARLSRAAEATARQLDPTDDEVRRILDGRARVLARPIEAPSSSVAEIELAFFSVGGEDFAVEVRHVLEVATLPETEVVPWVPPAFRGVANHRGEVLPIVDLSALISGQAQPAEGKWMIVLGTVRPELALSIDAADEVTTVALDAIRKGALSDILASIPFVRGIHLGHRLVVDGEALLADPRLSIREGS